MHHKYNFDSTHIVNNNNLWCSGYKMSWRTMIQDSADPLLSEDPLLSANPLLSEDPLLALLFVWKITIWFYSMLPTLPSELTNLGPLIFLLKNKIPSHMKKIDISCILHLLICILSECVCVCLHFALCMQWLLVSIIFRLVEKRLIKNSYSTNCNNSCTCCQHLLKIFFEIFLRF